MVGSPRPITLASCWSRTGTNFLVRLDLFFGNCLLDTALQWYGFHSGLSDAGEVFGEAQVQRPIQRCADLFLEARKLEQVNGAPQPLGNKPRELHSQDVSHASAASDRSQLAQS